MDARDAIKLGLNMSQLVCSAYLGDLTDEEMMMRPHIDCNHIKWQVGHLVTSEHRIIEQIAPGQMPPLPEGFEAKYSSETKLSDDPGDFDSKDFLLQVAMDCRAGTVKALEATSDERLGEAAPVEMQSYAPTIADAFSLQGSHWLMHCGQWVIVRRQAKKPIVI